MSAVTMEFTRRWLQDKHYLVLSGGGIHGINHLGFIAFIKFALGGHYAFVRHMHGFAGTSIGAFLSLLLTFGETNVWQLFRCMTNPAFFSKILNSINLQQAWKHYGAVPNDVAIDYIESLLNTYAHHAASWTFEDLYRHTRKELCVAVVNASTGEAEYHSRYTTPHFRVSHSVFASMCVPFLCQPMRIHDSIYFDGGLLDNFPMFRCGFPVEQCVGSYLETEVSINATLDRPPSIGSWAKFMLEMVYMMSRPMANVHFPHRHNESIVVIPQSKRTHFLKLWAQSYEYYRLFLRGLYYTRQHFQTLYVQSLLLTTL